MSLLNFPGIATVTPSFIRGLIAMAERHGWDPSGIALVISQESGFNPAAVNPRSGASGLIQFMKTTAEGLGTTVEAIRTMSAEEQLPYVEKFFQQAMRRVPSRLEDYELIVLGRGDLVNAPDDAVVFPASTNPKSAYVQNRELDKAKKGFVSVGDIRAHSRNFIARAKGQAVVVAAAAGVGVELLVLAGLGLFAWSRAKKAKAMR